MNPIIESELNKTMLVDLSDFDEETQTFHIPKYSAFQYETGHCYILDIDSSLCQPEDVVATNWNKGKFPTHTCYQVEVIKILQKMVYVNGFAYDKATNSILNQPWEGWFPLNKINHAEEVQS